VIVLFTDFGLQGPYTGQMKAVLYQMAPGIPAIDLFADAPGRQSQGVSLLVGGFCQ
jgi:S-adenosylmethionine hydrolase